MLRIILVDDEPIILEDLKLLIENNKNIEIAGMYTDPLEALRELPVTKADCAFLDIEMPGLSGIELAEKLSLVNPDIEVIFITAYNHYAAQAFELDAIDYLLKPIKPERIDKAIDKLLRSVKIKPESSDTFCQIRCFGSFEVVVGERSIKWSRSKSKEFLAYLLQYEGRWVAKYKLCDDQWSEYGPEQALAYLQTAIYALKKNLKEIGCTQIVIEYSDNRYMIKVKDADWDVREFEKEYEIFIRSGSLAAAKRAVQYYRGEYLEGEDWLWSDITRESFRRKYNEIQKKRRLLV